MFLTIIEKDADIKYKDEDGRDFLMSILKNFEFNKKIMERSIKYASYYLLKYHFEEYLKYCNKKIKHKNSKDLLDIIKYLYYNNYNFDNIDNYKECFLHHIKNIHPYIKILLITLYSGKESVSYENYTWFIKLLINEEWEVYKSLIAQHKFKYPLTLNHTIDNYFIIDFIIDNKIGGKKMIKDIQDALVTLCYKYAKYGKEEVRKFLNKQNEKNIEKLLIMNKDMNLPEIFKKDKILTCYYICLNKMIENMNL